MRHLRRLHHGTDPFKRLLIAWTVLLTLGTGFALWSGSHVLDRSLERMRGDVTRCFLSPERLRPHQVAECGREFDDPGTPQSDYEQVQSQTKANLRVFVDLQGRVARLEAAWRAGRR